MPEFWIDLAYFIGAIICFGLAAWALQPKRHKMVVVRNLRMQVFTTEAQREQSFYFSVYPVVDWFIRALLLRPALKAGQFKMVVETESLLNALAAHQGGGDAIGEAQFLVGELVKP